MGDTVSRTHYEDCWLVCHDCAIARVKRLQAGINQLRRELHDERVRRYEWEKMYYQAIAGTGVERLQAELALTHVKLNRVRQDAQDQSDEVQELWLSPCEAEGLRQQLARRDVEYEAASHAALVLEARLAEAKQRTEALAAMVTPELVELLEWLLRVVRNADVVFYSNSRLAAADELTTRIREALEE